MPQVSVIIPSYNRTHLLSRVIKSAFDQTFQNFEIIIVDDASTDTTDRLVASFHDRRIRYSIFSMQKTRGALPPETRP